MIQRLGGECMPSSRDFVYGYCTNPKCEAYRKIQDYGPCFKCGEFTAGCRGLGE